MKIIIREELISEINVDLRKNRILYLEAPCGWGKTILLEQLEAGFGNEKCIFIRNSECSKIQHVIETAIEKNEHTIFLVDNLGEWVVSGNIEYLTECIKNADIESRFILAGRIPLPAQLLPFKLTSQAKIYGKDKLKFTQDEVNQMCDIKLEIGKAHFQELYEISQGMPLFMAVASGHMEGAYE